MTIDSLSIFHSLKAAVVTAVGHQSAPFAILFGITLTAWLSYYLIKLLLYGVEYIIELTPTKWDDDLLNRRFMRALSQLAPAIVVNWLLPSFFTAKDGSTIEWLKTLTAFYILWAVIYIVWIFLDNFYVALRVRKAYRDFAVKGIFQMLKLVAIGAGIIIGISILIGREPIVILTALGASAAVLMLVFKDTILGLVASVQLTANKMLRRGDWIVVDKYDANGEVEDISLTTVKVRNWDNSISTIPPYALISDSFRNYQAMRDLKGRRVERVVYIDFESIRFLTRPELQTLHDNGFLIESPDATSPAVGNINIYLFRKYMEKYLADHQAVNTDMLLMVRQMEPTQYGLPLQLYFFTRITAWKDFEALQSDIFDHVFAILPNFHLRLYQAPAGTDFRSLLPNAEYNSGHSKKPVLGEE